MWMAFCLAREALPKYSSKFSRHDFTLPQLFACLVVKEHQRLSYRDAEALLRAALSGDVDDAASNPNGAGLPMFRRRMRAPSCSRRTASASTGPRTSYATWANFSDCEICTR